MARRRNKNKKSRKVLVMKVRRQRRKVPRITSVFHTKRTVNLANVGGLLVDGAYLTKYQNNLMFTTTNNSGIANYGSASLKARLYDIYNYSEYTVLWDRYKIDMVKIRITPFSTQAASGAAVGPVGQSAILIHSIYDYDDSDLPPNSEAGVLAMREYKNYKCKNIFSTLGKPITYTFKPRVATDVYAGGVTAVASKSEPFGWMDCNEPQVEGYSAKFIFETISAGATFSIYFKMDATYYLSIKDPR